MKLSKMMSKTRHGQKLMPSSRDTLQLGIVVENRLLEVCELYQRQNGIELQIPADLEPAALRWRGMLARWDKGDYRNTRDEFISLTHVAQWTLDVYRALRNQRPIKVEWAY